MKPISKPKVVNISLLSKDRPHHIHSQEYSVPKQTPLLSHCYQIIKLINNHRTLIH